MSDSLIHLLPPLKRARDYYLYDEKGNRYLDLYLDDGRALCGHRPNGLSNILKNTISRGVYAPYPSVFDSRLLKILKQGFPAFNYRAVFRSLESFERAFDGEIIFTDPAIEEDGGNAVLWRPYLSLPEGCSFILVKLPYPGIDAIAVLSADKPLPASDLLSPVTQAGMVRSWFDLQARQKELDKTVWSSLDSTGHWSRKGPYLKPLCSEKEYEELFRFYLRNNVLISPYYGKPSICAVDIKEGALKKILRADGEVQDG
jgi:hypothetical protein